jgi:hypothetical protein
VSANECKVHGEGQYVDGCSCDTTAIQAALRTTTKRLDDQVKINLQLRKDMGQIRDIAESRRRKVAELQRAVDTYALALKSVDNAVNLARKALREETGGPDRLIDVKSLNDPHERIIGADGQEVRFLDAVATEGPKVSVEHRG